MQNAKHKQNIKQLNQQQNQQTLQGELSRILDEGVNEVTTVLDIINFSLSFIVIIKYVISTYEPDFWSGITYGVLNFLMHLWFLMEYLLRMYGSKDRNKYMFSQESIADFISLIPYFFIGLVTNNIFQQSIHLSNWQKLTNLFDLFRILRYEKLKEYFETDISKQLHVISLSVFALILIAASGVQYLQRSTTPDPEDELQVKNFALELHYYIYFVLYTLSTIGYENIFPDSKTRILIIVLLFFAIIFIPSRSSQLVSLLSQKSQYARAVYKAVDSVPFIVVTGTVSSSAADDFFSEFFHEDHGSQQKNAVLLINKVPDASMEFQISKNQDIVYLEGDNQSEQDLKRSSLEDCKSIILLCNKQSSRPYEEDSKVIFQAMQIKKYLQSNKSPNTILILQLLRQEGKSRYYSSLHKKQTKMDQIICVEELKMTLLSKSCICPGLITFISNLIRSSGEPPEMEESAEWIEEYQDGMSFEIYKTILSKKFKQMTFQQASFLIFKKFGALLFGLEINSGKSSSIYLNPKNLVIPANKKVIGYVIAGDKKDADQIANYQDDEDNFTSVAEIAAFNSPTNKLIPSNTANNLNNLKKDNSTNLLKRKPSNKIVPTNNAMEEDENNNKDENNEEDENHDEDQQVKDSNHGEWNLINSQCYITKEKVNLKDITFITLENNILAQNHIILCGIVQNLLNFIIPLRSRYLSNYFTIVILNEYDLSDKQWGQISFFPEIYFIKGSPLSKKDLKRANIISASKVVILTPQQDLGNESSSSQRVNTELTKDEEDLLDACTLFKYKAVRKIRPDIQIVSELVSPTNFSFFLKSQKDYKLMLENGYVHTPLFASGEIYQASIMDSLCCQTYYNPAIISVLNLLLLGSDNKQNSNEKEKKKSDLIDKGIQNSNLFSMKIPTVFVGKRYFQLFEFLAIYKFIIPLAIYRHAGSKDNKIPYIYTNPKDESILNELDILLVLSPEQPGDDILLWGGPLEKQNDFEKLKPFKRSGSSTTLDRKIGSQDLSNDEAQNFIQQDLDIEHIKIKPQEKELINLSEKINKIMENLNTIQEESINLEQILNSREQNLNLQMKDIFTDELNKMIKQKHSLSNQSDSNKQNNLKKIQLENGEYMSDDSEDEMLQNN